MNAIAYVRISVKDQSTYSLDYQERSVRDYCTKNNINLLAVFKDDGESSYTFDRADWKALEQFIRKNKNVDYLVIFDHDRFSRNLAEALMKIKELQDKFGIRVLATTDSIDTDFTDPSTFMMRAFKYMMAESELHRIRSRTKAGMVQAAISGRYIAKAPWGYLNAKDGKDRSAIVTDEDKAVVVRMIFREFNRGTNIEEIRKIVEPFGYKQKSNSAIQRILSNPVYAGLIRIPAHKGSPEKTTKGLHDAMVSEADYWQAQQRLNRKGIVVQLKEEVPLRGVLKCTCGQYMTAGNSKSKSGRYYWYYLCHKHRKSLSATKLHHQLNEVLDLLSFSQRRIDWYAEKLGQEIAKQFTQRGEILAKTQKALRAINDKIEATEERYLLQPDLSKKVYDKVMSELRGQQVELQRRMNELNTDQEQYWRKLNELLPKLHDIRGTYETLDLQHKQQFINMVFDGSLSYDGEVYRTPAITPVFAHNTLILKEKGLLVIEQASINLGETPVSTPNGNPIELFMRLHKVLVA